MSAELKYQDNIAIITLKRPEARNALNADMIAKLQEFIAEISSLNLRAAIFTGDGHKAFCAGADITELQNKTPAAHLKTIQIGQNLFEQINQLKFPTLACINGAVIGGGLELAMACTFRICSPNARLGLPEIKLGLIPGYGGTQRLPRLVGQTKALELIISGKIITAEEALHIGLINRILDLSDPIQTGRQYLDEFGLQFPAAIQHAMQAVQAASELDIQAGLALEAELFVNVSQTLDAAEGIQAFLEKRPAHFIQK